ncbi:hypothetical protein NE237_015394 [Protea cynaroides]|uniref:Uncharacterized protein n=1 Tax=Protea cynaroides TaxID=273540 RepID=A0A9Q0KDR8_9MAGN|nr:hypothetical protein NE237_015394 [Protea cynaroides]
MASLESILVSGVQPILQTLASVATQEIGLAWGFRGELKKLQTTLTTIQGVLQDAENQQVEKVAVKDWLRRIKNVAYDADDVLDELKYEALRQKMKIQNRMMVKVRNFFSRSNPFAFRLKMAHKPKDINVVLDVIIKDSIFGMNLVRGESSADSTSMNKVDQQTFSLITDMEVVGRVDDKSKLMDLVVNNTSNDEIISVIPIVEWGDLERLLLLNWSSMIHSVISIFDLKMWVCLSQEFEIKRLLKEIIESAGAKYDVWSEDPEKWDKLKEPLKTSSVGSKVIVTTRNNEVARIMTTNYTHHLGILSEQECWSLFFWRAFSNGGPQETPNPVEIGRRIVNKCGGVPLAVKVLGSLMHSKTEECEWLSREEVCEIQNIIMDKSRGIMPILKLGYDHLSSHLKRCFAYCSVFPKNYTFYKKTLIQVWMAEGFIQQPKGRKQMEEVENDYFNILLWNSFFQDEEIWRYKDILRVLTVHSFQIKQVPLSIRKLKHLRFLDLSNNSIHLLPESITSLYNVQTLKLNDCFELQELPKEMRKIVSLRHIKLDWLNMLTEMPVEIGKLSNLQTLTRFIEGKDEGRSIKQLKCLNLRGNLIIKDLEDVTSGVEAREKDAHNLQSLELIWSYRDDGGSDNEKTNDVLEGLEPLHPNLEVFPLNTFPASFPCRNGKCECIGEEFYYNNNSSATGGGGALATSSSRKMTIAFPSLEQLLLAGVPNLVKWLEVLPSFPSLEQLTIDACFNLKITPSRFPSLKRLLFGRTNEMELIMSLSNNLIYLEFLCIYECEDLKSVPEKLLQNMLERLKVEDCPKLETKFSTKEGQEGSPLPLLIFPSLKELEVIKQLKLTGFEGLKSLPKGLQRLTMLIWLEIEDLQHLVSLQGLKLVGWPPHRTNLKDQLKHLTNLTDVNSPHQNWTVKQLGFPGFVTFKGVEDVEAIKQLTSNVLGPIQFWMSSSILLAGLWWPTMMTNVKDFVRTSKSGRRSGLPSPKV